MTSIQQLAITAIATIHQALNQINIPVKQKLELVIDNTKYLLSVVSSLIDEEVYYLLQNELSKAEEVLMNFEKVDADGNFTTYSEIQSIIEKKAKEREKFIIDKCLYIVSEILKRANNLVWQ